MLELVLVRHGEVDSNTRGTYVGWTNKNLNLNGIEGADKVAENLADEPFAAIYASPLFRAKETADRIKNKNGARLILYDGLKERNFGIFDDLTYQEICSKYPEENKKWEEDWLKYKIPKGESAMNAYVRNCEAIDDIISRHGEGKVCVVTHLGVIRNLIAHLLGLSISDSWRFRVGNASICRIQITDGYGVLTQLNA